MNHLLPSSQPVKRYLKNTISQLACSLIPLALEHQSFIINHISPTIELNRNEDILSHKMSDVLKNVLMVSKEQCIHILSDDTGETAIIQVSGGGSGFYNNLTEKMGSLQQTAENRGEFISIQFDPMNGTTINCRVA